MKHTITHSLDDATARRAAKSAADHYVERFQKYNPQVVWSTEDHADLAFSAKGVSVKGSLHLVPGAIEVDIKVPMLLRPFAGKAQDVIERELRKWTDRASNGDV